MIELRWIDELEMVNEHMAKRVKALQYRTKEQDIMQANINDWPWSDWKDVPMGLEQSK